MILNLREKPREIRVVLREVTADASDVGFMRGRWRHYCKKRRAVVLIESPDFAYPGAVFCPLCSAVGTDCFETWRSKDDARYIIDEYGGPWCGHGYPDRPCAEIVAAFPIMKHNYFCAIRAYRAVLAAPDLKLEALSRWARPCRMCALEYLEDHYELVETDLMLLCERLSKDSIAAQSRVLEIEDDVSLAFNLQASVRADVDRIRDYRAQAARTEFVRYVYAVGDGTAIKIGFSGRHPSLGRFAQLQTASAKELKLIGALVGTVNDERDLHRRFAEHHLRGEWFNHVSEIVEHFDKP